MPKASKPAPNTDRQSTTQREARDLPVTALNVDPLRLSAGLPSHTRKFPVAHTIASPSVQPDASQEQGGLLSRTGKFPMVGPGTTPSVQRSTPQIQGGDLLMSTGKHAASSRDVPSRHIVGVATAATEFFPQYQETIQSPTDTTVSAADNLPEQGIEVVQESIGITKYSNPMKVVKIPMVGQPGQFVTGLLPLAPNSQSSPRGRGQTPSLHDPTRNLTLTPRMKIALFIAAILLIAAGLAGFLWFTHHTHTPSPGAASTVMIKNIDGTNEEWFHGSRSINW